MLIDGVPTISLTLAFQLSSTSVKGFPDEGHDAYAGMAPSWEGSPEIPTFSSDGINKSRHLLTRIESTSTFLHLLSQPSIHSDTSSSENRIKSRKSF